VELDKIKVAILCDFKGEKSTGSRIYEKNLINNLAKIENIELHIFTLNDHDSIIEKNNMTIHSINKNIERIAFPNIFLLQKIKKQVIDLNPDITHAISSIFLYSTVLTFLKDMYPSVLTVYGLMFQERKFYRDKGFFTGLSSYLHVLNEKYVLSRLPNLIVDTESIKSTLSNFNNNKMYVLPAGVDCQEICVYQKKENTLEEHPDIFFVNNLITLKGADILIKAVYHLKQKFPQINVCIAGKGPQMKDLNNLIKKFDLEENIKLIGFISEETKYQLYNACKIVVVPSRWDCQPLGLFDAAACGKPVVASDKSNPGIVNNGETGLIFKSEDDVDLSEKLNKLIIDNETREKMGKKAKMNVEKYDWNRVAEKYDIIYREIIKDFNNQK
jgi:glycosyltransferase involved in cell wall biosynthesis